MNEVGIKKVLMHLHIQMGEAITQGDYFMIPCPFASHYHRGRVDNNPSFGIYISEEEESYYNCFSCKQGGRLWMLPDKIARIRNNNFGGDPEGMLLVQEIERDQNLNTEYKPKMIIEQNKDKPQPLNEYIFNNFFEDAWDVQESREYLQKRGITEETTLKLDLKFDDTEFGKRILFPVRGVDQKLYGYTGRTTRDEWIGKKYIDSQGKTRVYGKAKDYHGFKKRCFLLGEHVVDKNKPTLVVEGLFAYANLINKEIYNLCNIIALLGSVMTQEKADTLIKLGNPVYLMLDNDPAGAAGIYGVFDKNGKKERKGAIDYLYNYIPLFIPEYPEGVEDIDDINYEQVDSILNLCYPYFRPYVSNFKKVNY